STSLSSFGRFQRSKPTSLAHSGIATPTPVTPVTIAPATTQRTINRFMGCLSVKTWGHHANGGEGEEPFGAWRPVPARPLRLGGLMSHERLADAFARSCPAQKQTTCQLPEHCEASPRRSR